MKKVFVIFSIIIVLSALIGFIFISLKKPIKFDNQKFTLKYSDCDTKKTSCLNEYYKKDEKDKDWTELFTVVYVKTTEDPIAFARELAEQVEFASVTINYQENYAVVSFLIPYKNDDGDLMVEQNIAKVMKYNKGEGVVSQQYARRLKMGNKKQETTKTIEDNFTKYSPVLTSIPVQKVYLKPLEKW